MATECDTHIEHHPHCAQCKDYLAALTSTAEGIEANTEYKQQQLRKQGVAVPPEAFMQIYLLRLIEEVMDPRQHMLFRARVGNEINDMLDETIKEVTKPRLHVPNGM